MFKLSAIFRKKPAEREKKRILIADDEAPIRKLSGIVLTMEFPDVGIDEACNGV